MLNLPWELRPSIVQHLGTRNKAMAAVAFVRDQQFRAVSQEATKEWERSMEDAIAFALTFVGNSDNTSYWASNEAAETMFGPPVGTQYRKDFGVFDVSWNPRQMYSTRVTIHDHHKRRVVLEYPDFDNTILIREFTWPARHRPLVEDMIQRQKWEVASASLVPMLRSAKVMQALRTAASAQEYLPESPSYFHDWTRMDVGRWFGMSSMVRMDVFTTNNPNVRITLPDNEEVRLRLSTSSGKYGVSHSSSQGARAIVEAALDKIFV